ncbi:Got1-domain-containing protein [Ascodesmis nigricans]|uniref:Got1-domain-containing protein n=1 Tax=Ascodesmis nigricans TaxID=341454 RepID=A0A4S2MKI0_9PEZI|nr:Got1-domain-containing protein [Ascodesmis nigricans]
MWLSDNQKIGLLLLSLSLGFILLGLTLFFDRACLSLGNLLFLCGVTFLLGPTRTLAFFARKEKFAPTVALAVGILLVLARWTVVGFIVELWGVWGLFRESLGVVVGFVGSVPVVGPKVESVLRRITGEF